MARSIEAFKSELQKIRTGRAHPGILDQVQVDYYGSMVPISQVANVTLLDARTISVQPWEKGMGAKIEKAIRESRPRPEPGGAGRPAARADAGADRRAPQGADQGRAPRRRGGARSRCATCAATPTSTLRSCSRTRQITEDEERRSLDEVQKLTDRTIAEIDRLVHGQGSRDHGGLRPSPLPIATSAHRDDRSRSAVPRHVAIVMDGNGRWAKKRFMPRFFGHKQGVDALVRTVQACADRGIEYLTVFAFSSENWKRPTEEVSGLMGLVLVAVSKYLAKLAGEGVRIRIVGDRSAGVRQAARGLGPGRGRAPRTTRRITLSVAFNYGGRWDIVQACRAGHRRRRAARASSTRHG